MSDHRLPDLLPAFSKSLGIELISAEPDKVVASLVVSPAMGNRNGVMHGGAIMSFADTIGGVASAVNLNGDSSTTTLESKTNFLRSATIGSHLVGTCIPIHKGRKTMVWTTEIAREDGKLVSVTIQTQLTISWQVDDG